MDFTRVRGGNILVAFSFVTLERKLYTIVSPLLRNVNHDKLLLGSRRMKLSYLLLNYHVTPTKLHPVCAILMLFRTVVTHAENYKKSLSYTLRIKVADFCVFTLEYMTGMQ